MESLGGDNLIVEGSTEIHSSSTPGVEVVSGRDGAARAVRLTDGPELGEGLRSVDGGLVYAQSLIDVIH